MTPNKHKLVFASLLLSLSFLPAESMAAGKLDAVESLTVDVAVSKPDKAKFVGLASRTGEVVSGLIGGAIMSKDKTPEGILNESLRQQKVDAGQLLYEKVQAGLAKSGLSAKLKESSTTKLKLTIMEYGVGRAAGFKDNMHPYMTARARIEDADGKVLWKKSAYMTNAYYKAMTLRPGEEWIKHPEYLATGFSQVAEFLAADLVKGL